MTLTASGLGSGLDINNIVSQLMSVERQPIAALATREAGHQARLSAFGQLRSALSTLQTAANGLNDASRFAATKATASANAGFSATSSASAPTGSFAVETTQLAATQRVASNATVQFVPADGSTDAKTLEIEFGRVADGIFTGNGDVKSLSFTGSTIEALRDAINSGDMGVSASIVDNGNVRQLVLSGKESGAAQAFRIGGDVGLEFDPADPTANTSINEIQAAQNAVLKVDGLQVERGTNTISDVLEGVTLTLSQPGSGSLTVSQDNSAARSAIDAFVKAYNDANNTIKNLTNYDADNRRASTLTGDSTARSAQTFLRNTVGSVLGGLGNTTSLSELGIRFQREGGLAIDSTRLDAALRDPDRNVGSFFAGANGIDGFAKRLSSGLSNFVDSTGLIASRTEGINESIKSINRLRATLNLRLEATEARYRAQFTALDIAVASMTETSQYLTAQLANLPSINKK